AAVHVHPRSVGADPDGPRVVRPRAVTVVPRDPELVSGPRVVGQGGPVVAGHRRGAHARHVHARAIRAHGQPNPIVVQAVGTVVSALPRLRPGPRVVRDGLGVAGGRRARAVAGHIHIRSVGRHAQVGGELVQAVRTVVAGHPRPPPGARTVRDGQEVETG